MTQSVKDFVSTFRRDAKIYSVEFIEVEIEKH